MTGWPANYSLLFVFELFSEPLLQRESKNKQPCNSVNPAVHAYNECVMKALPRFLCDEMLGHLCRYLRAAGYDAVLAQNGENDAELLRQSHNEGRYFLTQDTLISEHKAARGVALILPTETLDQLAAQLGKRYHLDWLSHAFTRCIVDNTPLVPADDAAIARAPSDALRPGEQLQHCPTCGRIYWRGSHYKRMRLKLAAWQAAQTNH